MRQLAVDRGASLVALLLAAAVAAAATASATHSSTAAPVLNGFAGPVASAPRAIDRDLERSTPGTLRQVVCPTGSAYGCWIAGR